MSRAAGGALLAPLVLGAVASVLYWARFDDLRPYVLAQFLPMLLIPLMLVLLPGRRPTAPLIWGVVTYAVGKVAELSDGRIFALGGVVSGHTIKHVLAAAEVPVQQRLDELWDELPEVRVQAVDVLRPLPLGELPLRPRELEVEAGVERVLRRSHPRRFDAALKKPGRYVRAASRAARSPRTTP